MNCDELRQKVKALLSKTVSNGCTEAEALAAAEKAADLMKQYDLSAEELDVTESIVSCSIKVNPRYRLYACIAHATNTVILRSSGRMVFHGVEPGPEIAVYLFNLCNRAIDTALNDFKKDRFYKSRRTMKTRRAASNDFVKGISESLLDKIYDLFKDTISEEKQNIAIKVIDRLCPSAGSINFNEKKERYEEALFKGSEAGRKVPIHHGVNRSYEKPLQIGETL